VKCSADFIRSQLLYILFLLLMFGEANAEVKSVEHQNPTRDCLTVHIKEALEINELRKPIYSQLSEGRSESVSNLMIRSEQFLLFIAPIFDSIARYWQSAKIGVACEDFVSMSLTPNLGVTSKNKKMQNTSYKVFDTKESIQNIRNSLNESQFAAHAAFVQEIKKISAEPFYHCMTRHILESAARSLFLLPKFEKLSLEKGKYSPKVIVNLLVRAQLESLPLAQILDEKAGPLQQEGVPIVCNDVPTIPYENF
jgi:hypothetical protein